jgi:hypothetical protein
MEFHLLRVRFPAMSCNSAFPPSGLCVLSALPWCRGAYAGFEGDVRLTSLTMELEPRAEPAQRPRQPRLSPTQLVCDDQNTMKPTPATSSLWTSSLTHTLELWFRIKWVLVH